ncbi:MAG TPA: hypothetical protein VFS07_08500 [Gemmatimonadales bacterium]|jgi:hypothetical protein|nr:hypothetical protein [Gemmatimonadales bacterium]
MPRRRLLLLALLAGCAHSLPDEGSQPQEPPLGAGFYPRALTYNEYDDRHPQWLPDGSAIIYSTERGDQQSDRDRCLALIPAEGGTQLWRRCETRGAHYRDTTDVWEWPAVAPDGRTFFVRTTGWSGLKKTGMPTIALAHGTDFENAVMVRRLPYISTSGLQVVLPWTPRWLSPTRVAYLGVLEFFEGSTFYPDTFFTGQEVTLLDLAGDSLAGYTVVPGTQYASSVATDGDPDVLYYTLNGDSMVYRRHLTGGQVDTVHNFGWGQVARDVTVRGTTLVAVVGDSIIWRNEAAHGWVQRDEGGDLVKVDLTTGLETRVSDVPLWLYRHPELSPDGKRLVVERQPFAEPPPGVLSDYNAMNHRADLWLFAMDQAPFGGGG